MTEEEVEKTRGTYISALKPLFLPEFPFKFDAINYFSSLLRVVGMEDKGWDPFLESRLILENLNAILQLELPETNFPQMEMTKLRLALLMYSHMVEMDAPYEVITNLLRYRLGKGYSPNPFYIFLNKNEKKRFKNIDISPTKKIEIIKFLFQEANLTTGNIFDDFFRSKLRNAISHSDYIITDEEFRCRGGPGAFRPFKISLIKLSEIISKARIFYSTFFALERETRELWGKNKNQAQPYDIEYKGLLEILVDANDLMCGFKVHWPNSTESVYKRTEDGIEMKNCNLDIINSTISLFVSQYAQNPSEFSPLVETGTNPIYTPTENGLAPFWTED